jgi:NAD(P)-dependent dehydrogenase (short-subunit alcohol dehydrogenase family)
MAGVLMLFSLNDRVALVTGGAGHLGRAICRGLAEAGARVLINGRNREKADDFAAILRREGHAAEALAFDVTDHEGVARCFGELPQLDILVNNAALGQTGTIATTSASAFGPVAASAAEAAYALTKAALPLMRSRGAGSVINIASMYGMVSPDPRIYGHSGYDNPPQYGVAKAGLIQLTRYLACHLAPDRIRVNAVSPGPFPPVERLEREQPQFLRMLQEKVPMQRVGRPEELSGAVVFLASDASSYITGANIPVDGGWTAW